MIDRNNPEGSATVTDAEIKAAESNYHLYAEKGIPVGPDYLVLMDKNIAEQSYYYRWWSI